MEKNIGEYLSRKSTEVIAIVACIGLIITIILAAGSIRTEQEKAHMFFSMRITFLMNNLLT